MPESWGWLRERIAIDAPELDRYGIHVKHPSLPYVDEMPMPGVKLFTGLGGGGMTLSFGLAEKIWGTLG